MTDIGHVQFGSPVSVVGDRLSAPAYISGMSQFDVQTLSSVSGYSTFTGMVQGLYSTAPKDWWNLGASGVSAGTWWNAWNGGFGPGGDQANTHQMPFKGGGHNDGSFNGLPAFDFNGTTQATGFVMLDEPSDTADAYTGLSSGNPGNRYSDGNPGSLHMFGGNVTTKDGYYVTVSGAGNYTDGGFTSATEVYETTAWRNPQPPSTPVTGVLSALYDAVTDKVFVYNSANFNYAFFDVQGNTWSALKVHAGTSPGQATWVLDPIRRGAGDVTNAFIWPSNQVKAIDWTNETVVDNGTHNATGTTVSDGNGGFYDAVEDALWIFGAGTSSWSTIYKISGLATPASLTTQSNSLSGSMVMSAGAQVGFYGRWCWMADWRALGFAGDDNSAAQVIKL